MVHDTKPELYKHGNLRKLNITQSLNNVPQLLPSCYHNKLLLFIKYEEKINMISSIFRKINQFVGLFSFGKDFDQATTKWKMVNSNNIETFIYGLA